MKQWKWIDRNYKQVDKKKWRVLKCKEMVALRDFLYKVWFVQLRLWKVVSGDN